MIDTGADFFRVRTDLAQLHNPNGGRDVATRSANGEFVAQPHKMQIHVIGLGQVFTANVLTMPPPVGALAGIDVILGRVILQVARLELNGDGRQSFLALL